jgi:hypothetical protein
MSTDTLETRIFNLPRTAVIWSLILHISLPLWVLTYQMLERNHLLPFSQPKKLDKDLYQNFIQVDVVALPDQLISDKTKPDTTLPIVDKPQSSKEEVKPDKEDPVLEAKEEAAKAKAEMEAKRQADIKSIKSGRRFRTLQRPESCGKMGFCTLRTTRGISRQLRTAGSPLLRSSRPILTRTSSICMGLTPTLSEMGQLSQIIFGSCQQQA